MTPDKLVDPAELGKPAATVHGPDADRMRPYVPRTFQLHLVDDPTSRWWTADGTAAFVDISGFTQLSEQLARKGREGAEQITDAIERQFRIDPDRSPTRTAVACSSSAATRCSSGSTVQDHAERACRVDGAHAPRAARQWAYRAARAQVTLSISQGVHSGLVPFFRGRHLSRRVAAGRSGVDAPRRHGTRRPTRAKSSSAPRRPRCWRAGCVGDAKGPGLLLQREPPGMRQDAGR